MEYLQKQSSVTAKSTVYLLKDKFFMRWLRLGLNRNMAIDIKQDKPKQAMIDAQIKISEENDTLSNSPDNQEVNTVAVECIVQEEAFVSAVTKDHASLAFHPQRFVLLRALAKNPLALIAGSFLLFLLIIAITAGWLFPGDPLEMVAPPLLWPGEDMQFLLGSDSLGRHVMVELAHGVRVSLMVGFFSAAMSLTIGLVVGCLSGYFGGWVDKILMRVTELFQTIPSFLLVIVLVVIGGPQIKVIVFAIGIASWPIIARLTRAEFRSLRESEFVLAARSQGFSHARIIFHEILPNALPPVIVTTSVLVATAILMEAALAFLGLGDPNVVSWGSMIGEGRDQLRTAWYLTAIPGVAIVLTVLSLNLLGDALNDTLNPRIRNAS